ncbi:MAG TPA: hypothetical protein VF145_00760, partial [Chitinophagaceae bacterium]
VREQKNKYPEEPPSYSLNKTRVFKVLNNELDRQRLQANSDLQELNNAWREFLEKDPYLQVCYTIATQLIH